MNQSRPLRSFLFNDLGILVLFALAKLVFHILTNGAHGFHRDELQLLDDARYLPFAINHSLLAQLPRRDERASTLAQLPDAV